MIVVEDDHQWTAPVRRGDPEAFETLVRRYQRMVHALTFRMTGSAADADDLAQETFIQAYRHLGDFRGQSRVSSWLYRIAVNQCLNWLKRRQRQERLHEEVTGLDPRPAEPDAALADQIQAALMELSPPQRAAIVLTVYDGLTHAEAAAALGCSETTISWRIFVARRKLRKLLKGTATARGNT